MKKILLCLVPTFLLLNTSCDKSYDCNCTETSNAVVIDDYTFSGEGASALDVCNGQDEQYSTGTETVIVDCEPK